MAVTLIIIHLIFHLPDATYWGRAYLFTDTAYPMWVDPMSFMFLIINW